MEKCPDCNCPDVRYSGVHFSWCPKLRGRNRWKITKDYLLETLQERLEYYKKRIKEYEKEIIEIQQAHDSIKETCLDEVYECRWDCITGRLEAA